MCNFVVCCVVRLWVLFCVLFEFWLLFLFPIVCLNALLYREELILLIGFVFAVAHVDVSDFAPYVIFFMLVITVPRIVIEGRFLEFETRVICH